MLLAIPVKPERTLTIPYRNFSQDPLFVPQPPALTNPPARNSIAVLESLRLAEAGWIGGTI